MEPTELLTTIEGAFPVAPLPAMSLHQALLADQSLTRTITSEEWAAAHAKDGHIHWTDISDASLLEFNDALAHLDEEAFAYYLGAFLRFGVRHVAGKVLSREAELLCSIVFSVTHRSNYNLGRLKRLNDVQIECVARFLQFLVEFSSTHTTEAADALARYWLTPEARRRSIVYVP